MLSLLQFGPPEFFFGGFVMFFFFIMMLGTGFFILPIIAVVHVLIRDDMEGLQKLVWILLVFFVPFVWLVYFLLGRERTAGIFSELDRRA